MLEGDAQGVPPVTAPAAEHSEHMADRECRAARLAGLFLATAVAFPVAPLGGAPLGNGDVNGSGGIDLSDAVYLLGWLFRGSDGPVAIVCPPPGGGPLPATGQTNCYTDGLVFDAPCDSVEFPGQDGFYAASCPNEFRFVDNGDGTVTDHCTGLVWQQDTEDTNGDGSIGDEDRLTWGEALRYCDRLDFAGHSDWRLPNVTELVSIVDYGRTSSYPRVIRRTPDNAAIDPVFGALSKEWYWASTSLQCPSV